MRKRAERPEENQVKIMEITIAELASLIRPSTAQEAPSRFWIPGAKYFIRTVTHHHTGVLVEAGPQEILLSDAAWIADDGRLTDALKTGEFNEVEIFPVGLVAIGRASIIDATQIKTIPVSQK